MPFSVHNLKRKCSYFTGNKYFQEAINEMGFYVLSRQKWLLFPVIEGHISIADLMLLKHYIKIIFVIFILANFSVFMNATYLYFYVFS